MGIHLTPFSRGHLFLIGCCVFYLAWWLIAFKPEGAVKGFRSGWLLIPAAIFGVLAVWQIVSGVSGTAMDHAAIPTARVCVAGIILYAVLLAGSCALWKRPVTTELFLIVGWLTMMAAEINAHSAGNTFDTRKAAVLLAVSLVIAIVSLICYLAYYDLDAVKGYVVGAAPLILVLCMSAAMVYLLH